MNSEQNLLVRSLIYRNLDVHLHSSPVVTCSRHHELRAAIGRQPIREIRVRNSELCFQIMADQSIIAPEPARQLESYFLYSLASRTDPYDGHSAAKWVASHVQQKKVLVVILVVVAGKDDEIEACEEAQTVGGTEGAPPHTHTRAWPKVRAGYVVQHCRREPGEATGLAGAVARRVQARQEVLLAAVVHRRLRAAVVRVRAWATRELHHGLHGVAPAVAAGQGDAAEVTLVGGPELVTAGRAHHVPHLALHGPMHK